MQTGTPLCAHAMLLEMPHMQHMEPAQHSHDLAACMPLCTVKHSLGVPEPR